MFSTAALQKGAVGGMGKVWVLGKWGEEGRGGEGGVGKGLNGGWEERGEKG